MNDKTYSSMQSIISLLHIPVGSVSFLPTNNIPHLNRSVAVCGLGEMIYARFEPHLSFSF